MATTLNCSTSSIVSTQVTIVYGVIYGLSFLLVSVYSFRFLNKYNEKFSNANPFKKLIKWLNDVWKRRRCYIPIITHLFDQITDISVAFQFYELSISKSGPNNDWLECGGLNMWYLFILTILSMVIYRVISSYLIYKSCNNSIQHFIFQLLDIELFRALYINYLCNKSEPCSPQRWITAMEASLESAPQALIQMIYLVKTDTFSSSLLVLISLLSSLWSIISKLVSDDQVIVVPKAKKAKIEFHDFHLIIIDLLLAITALSIAIIALIIFIVISPFICCYYIWILIQKHVGINCCCQKHQIDKYEMEIAMKMKNDDAKITEKEYNPIISQPTLLGIDINDDETKEDIKHLKPPQNQTRTHRSLSTAMKEQEAKTGRECCCCRFNRQNHLNWMSFWYLLRFIWRILDVSSRIFICTLMWNIIGGTHLSFIIVFEFIAVLTISYKTKQTEFIFGIVALVVSKSSPIAEKISTIIFVYRSITNYILMILITIWLILDFECWRCTDYILRQKYLNNDIAIFSLFIYCWICVFFIPYIMIYLWWKGIFIENASTSRSIQDMISSVNYDGIIEQQLYAGNYDYFDEKNRNSLIMLALQQKAVPVVQYLYKHTKIKLNEKNVSGSNILDYYCKNAVSSDLKQANDYRTMTPFLLKLYKQYPDLKDLKGRNAFLCGCHNQELDIYDKFVAEYPDIVFSTDGAGKDMFAYLWKFEKWWEYFDVVAFYTKYPKMIEKDGKTGFFHAAHYKKKDVVEALLSLNLEFAKSIDFRNQNILDYYTNNPELLKTSDLIRIYDECGDVKGKYGRDAFLCSVLSGNMNVVHYFMENRPQCIYSYDESNKNMFSFLWKRDFMKKLNPLDFYETFPKFIDVDGKSPFFYALASRKQKIVEKLINNYPDLINRKDDKERNILDYYCADQKLLSTDNLIYIWNYNKHLKTENKGLSVFLCCCYSGNLEATKQIIELSNGDVLHDKNEDKYNAVSVALIDGWQDIVEYLRNKHNLNGKKPEKIRFNTQKQKILLLGIGECGKTTIFKHLRIIFDRGFDSTELFTTGIHTLIASSMMQIIHIINVLLTDGCDDEYKLEQFDDYTKIMIDELTEDCKKDPFDLNESLFKFQKLWSHSNIQQIIEMSDKYHLLANLSYFMDDIGRIWCPSYVPTERDVLMSYRRTVGITVQQLSVNNQIYEICDTGGQRSERKKWIHIFDNVTAVIYVVDISGYNRMLYEDDKTNDLYESLDLFKKHLINNKILKQSYFLIFFNKIDLYKKKLNKYPINSIPEWNDYYYDNVNEPEYEYSIEYFKKKFEQTNEDKNRQIITHTICAVDTDIVKRVFNTVFKDIVQLQLKNNGLV